MANRRMGGMGGPRGNRNFSQPFQGGGGGVNPWQGPPNPMNQGLISQLSSNPQQLALALTSLIQSQQPMNNPPSLLSLNTASGYPGQNRDFNRFGRGRDNRRHEPYNKNRNGWKSDNKRQNQSAKKPATKDNKKDEKNNSDEKKGEDTKDSEDKAGPYHGVPVKFLNCFVCNKAMWDGESMHKHVKGRAHREMLDKLEESIHISVNILRENMRLAEEKKVIELYRQQRTQKKHQRMLDVESQCNMCELKFLGKIVVHRKTEGHQRLKRYLHPNCKMCDKEFPSRIEWIEHRLTPEHMRKLNEMLKTRTGGGDGDIIIEEENELNLVAVLEEPLQMESENPILELEEDMSANLNLPAYKPDRAVSTKSLKPFDGFRCELCRRSFANEELSQMHLKTKMHYFNFVEAAKVKHQKDRDQQKKKEKEGKQEKADMYDPEEACNDTENDGDQTMETADEGDPSVANDTEMEASQDDDHEEEEEEKVEEKKHVVKEEKQEKPVTSTPARPVRGGAVKNGAGPKSKKTPARK
nr:unnamed protein product [Callosobruchus analis]